MTKVDTAEIPWLQVTRSVRLRLLRELKASARAFKKARTCKQAIAASQLVLARVCAFRAFGPVAAPKAAKQRGKRKTVRKVQH
jgi:hypothetical protein